MTRSRVLFATAAITLAIPDVTGAQQSNQPAPPNEPVVWITFGDSYSSGEGIPDAGAPCARSQLSFGPVAASLLRSQRHWTIPPDLLVACTGDVAADLFNARPPDGNGNARPSQLDWAREAGLTGHADVVLLSFGGNDIGFGAVIESCINVPTSFGEIVNGDFIGRTCPARLDGQPFEEALHTRIDNLVSTGERSDELGATVNRGEGDGSLVDLYTRVLDDLVSPDGLLVVVGYPRLFAPSDDWGAWRHGRCAGLQADDADALGRVAEHLDRAIRQAAAAADPSGSRVVFVSRLDIFDQGARGSHALCGGQTEWINRVTIGLNDPEIRPGRSYHPNAPGHAATAEVIANQLSGRLLSAHPSTSIANLPTTINATPIEATGTFEIGDDFDSSCIVAWPTAPTRTTQGIEMTMSCTGVPNQFLFVQVFYPDPDLPITPSTGRVNVHGEIVDIAESEFGYRTLLVIADEVAW